MFAQNMLLAGAAGAAGVTDTAVYVGGSATNGGSPSSISASGADIGTATDDRWVVVCFASTNDNNTRTVSSFTLGGAPADYSETNATRFSTTGIGLWKLTTGTTATASVSLSGGTRGMAIQVYTFQSSAVNPTHASTSVAANSTTINVADGGAVFACFGVSGGGSGNAWTGVTEGAEVDGNSNEWVSTGGIGSLSLETGRTVSYSATVSNGASLSVYSVSPN